MSKERILSLLAQGLKQSQVSTIVGCSPAYVSQLVKDENFQKELIERIKIEAPNLDEDKALTNKYTAMEHKILEQMEQAMPAAELPALTQALKAVAERQDRRAQRMMPGNPLGGGATNIQVINLTLPAHAVPEYQVNQSNEVIQIGSKAMSPLSSEGVKNLFRQLKAEAAESVQPLTEF